jgi:hypothetical protein
MKFGYVGGRYVYIMTANNESKVHAITSWPTPSTVT